MASIPGDGPASIGPEMTARPRIPTAATAPRPWLGWVVAAGAFVAGLATDAIGAGHA